MAAEHYFLYRVGGREVIPRNATHVSIDESITVIPGYLFHVHPNIVELICHSGVQRIEKFALFQCPRLRRLISPGVEVVEEYAFSKCESVNYVECPKLERIGCGAFDGCKSLSSINLPSAMVVEEAAFDNCHAMTDVKFGSSLESIEGGVFYDCLSLEQITIPLKNGFLTNDDVFQTCDLKRVVLVEREVLDDTIATLLLDEWRNDMKEEVDSINHVLPNASTAGIDEEGYWSDGEKAMVIREWIARVLRKIVYYKVEHRRLLNEAVSTLQNTTLPNDIVSINVLPFLELPSHTFEGE